MNEVVALFTPWQRAISARKGISDPQLDEFRWLLEELRVSLFAQELKTPMPVSVKRLQKVWARRAMLAPCRVRRGVPRRSGTMSRTSNRCDSARDEVRAGLPDLFRYRS